MPAACNATALLSTIECRELIGARCKNPDEAQKVKLRGALEAKEVST